MSVRSGLGAQLGVATEEAYGTYKAPTRFFPFESESLSLEKNYIKTAGLRAGRLSQAKNLHRATTRSVGGDFSINFFDQGMGILLNQLHGETVTPTKIEEKSKRVYKQTHKIGTSDPFAKSLTIEVGRPDVEGTVQPFSYTGCKIVEFKLSIDAGGVGMVSVSIDGQDQSTEEELGEATYDADALPYTFQEMGLTFGGSEMAFARNIEIAVAIAQNTERYNLGNSGVKDTPIVNDLLAVTASGTFEFSSLTSHNRYLEETTGKLVLTGTGAEIGSERETFKSVFTMPTAKQVSSSPVVGGPDIVTEDITFECIDNGTEAPLTVEILSTDSAL